MAVIIRGKPPTYDWGWFSREDQRMHLQVVDRLHWKLHYKVWLEREGKKVFEPEPGIPAKQDLTLNEEFAMLEIFPQRPEGARIHERLEDLLWTY